MAKKNLTLFIFVILISVFFCTPKEKNKDNEVLNSLKNELYSLKVQKIKPLQIVSGLTKDKKFLKIYISINKDFAIQNSKYNDLNLIANGKTKKLKLTGKLRMDKKEYFEILNPFKVPADETIKYRLKGKLFFCNLVKSFCQKKDIDIDL